MDMLNIITNDSCSETFKCLHKVVFKVFYKMYMSSFCFVYLYTRGGDETVYIIVGKSCTCNLKRNIVCLIYFNKLFVVFC